MKQNPEKELKFLKETARSIFNREDPRDWYYEDSPLNKEYPILYKMWDHVEGSLKRELELMEEFQKLRNEIMDRYAKRVIQKQKKSKIEVQLTRELK